MRNGEKNVPNGCNPVKKQRGRSKTARVADFLFEAGMLRKTPRTGYQFLGSGAENVAEHSFRASLIGWVLALHAGVDAAHTAMLCLVHDFHEARTGDFNYVNSIYNTKDAESAAEHAVEGSGLEDAFLSLWREQEYGDTPEAALAHDADQIDLICNLVEERNLGNPYATKWLECVLQRLKTPQGKELAAAVVAGDHTDWWFKGPNPDWWVKKVKK